MADAEVERDPVEILADEFVERLRMGEYPSVAEYAAKHPECAEEIRDLFPAIAALERLNTSRGEEQLGRAVLEKFSAGGFGDFRIIREIGRGGMGVVFEAEQESLKRRVALKVLPALPFLDATRSRRFQREAHTAARLQHKNIVPVFGVGQEDGVHYIVMQLIRGMGLNEFLDRRRRSRTPSAATETLPPKADTDVKGVRRAMPPASELFPGLSGTWCPDSDYCRNVARIGLQAAEALRYAHSEGTLHRDIKPANLLLDAEGTVWVTDFGLAQTCDDERLSRTGDPVGTLRYMAPEQFDGCADPRSDVYSLGLTLYELLTLQPAFADSDRGRLMWKISHSSPMAPRKLNPQIPRDLETIVLKAIARDPADRYQSAGELAADMQAFLADRPVEARRANPAERLWRLTRRNPLVAGLTLAVVALLALVIVIVTIDRDERPAEAAAAETPDQPTPQVDQYPEEPPYDLPPPHLPGPPDDPLGLGPGGHPPHHPLRGTPGRKLRPPPPRHPWRHPLPEPVAGPAEDDQQPE